MGKLDLKKQYRHLYMPSAKRVSLVDVPALNFLMVDGQIESGVLPGDSTAFQDAVGALYATAYGLKFKSKLRSVNPIDYTVMALEGLWWVEEGPFDLTKPGDWRWTVMIMQPDHIDEGMVAEALAEAREKKENPALDKLRFDRWEEGPCIQIMHIGPYADEPRTLEKMHAFARDNGYEPRGKHHEIYIGDPRRAKPERLKTVLRQPVSGSG